MFVNDKTRAFNETCHRTQIRQVSFIHFEMHVTGKYFMDVFTNYSFKKVNMRLYPEQIVNHKKWVVGHRWATTWNCYAVICFRSHCGYTLVCCSLDGTVACMEFTPDELGKPLSTEEKVSLNFIYWSRGVFRAKSDISDGGFCENITG